MEGTTQQQNREPESGRLFGKKDKKFLVELAGTMAALSRPTYNRNLGWLDLMEVSGHLEDGGMVSFQLGMVSHITSHRPNPEQSSENPPDPRELPAVIHFQNGDFCVMRDNFATWVYRLEEGRGRAFNNLLSTLESKR